MKVFKDLLGRLLGYFVCLSAILLYGSIELLAAPQPKLNFNVSGPQLVGSNINIGLTVANESVTLGETGYGPFFEVVLPPEIAGATSVTNTSPGGAPVTVYSFGGYGILGATYTNPITGETRTLNNNEKWLIVTAPTGTIAVGQPALEYNISTTPTVALVYGTPFSITGRAIFSLGAIANGFVTPCGGGGDTICQVTPSTTTTAITPVPITLSKSVNGFSNATGPNYPRTFQITGDISNSASLTGIVITDTIPDTFVVTTPIAPNCTGMTITPVPVSCSYTADPNGGGSFSANFGDLVGASGTDISISFAGYVQKFLNNDGSTNIINSSSGNTTTSVNTAQVTYSLYGVPQAPVVANANISQASVDLQKSSALTNDIAPSGVSPGDTITHTVTAYVSDYFSFDNLVFADDLLDGQTYVPNSFNARIVEGATDQTVNPTRVDQSIFGSNLIVQPKDLNGITHLDFNMSGSLSDPGIFNLNNNVEGADNLGIGNPASKVIITYQSVIDENYVGPLPPGSTQVIDGRDTIGNTANSDFTVLGTSNHQNRVANSSVTVAGLIESIKTNAFINGAVPVPPLLIGAGDDLTYKVRVTFQAGDAEDFKFKDFLPTPIFNISDPNFDGIPSGFTQIAQGDTAPAAGQWRYTTASFLPPGEIVTLNPGENSLEFDFGDGIEDGAGSSTRTVEVLFTIRATNRPMADGLLLVNVLFFSTANSFVATAQSAATAPLVTQTPQLTMTKVAKSVVLGNGTILGENFINVDSGDELQYEVTLENIGSDTAYDVNLLETLPTWFQTPGGGYNLSITDGGGSAPCNIASFSDISNASQVQLQAGQIPAGAICKVTYTLQSNATVVYGQTYANPVRITYASEIAGPTFSPLSDTVSMQVAIPAITKSYLLGSSSDVLTPDPSLSHSELVSFRFLVTVPEGTTSSFMLRENEASFGNPSGNFFNNFSPASITQPVVENNCINGNPALFNYVGQTAVCFTNNPALPANQSQTDSQNYQINYGTLYNFNTNPLQTEQFAVDFQAQVRPGATSGNYLNYAQLYFHNGTALTNIQDSEAFAISTGNLALTKQVVSPAGNLKIGDTIRYRLTVLNNGTFPSYNVANIVDSLPAGLGAASLVSATYDGIDITGQAGFSFSQILSSLNVSVINNSNVNNIDTAKSYVVIFDAPTTGTMVADSTVGPGHPGGVVDPFGCVNRITNSFDIASFDTGPGGTGVVISAINAATVNKNLDSDGDSIANSIEGCTDSDSDGVADYLDTDSDDNGVLDSVEYNAGRDLDGDGRPDYKDLDDDGDNINDWVEITNAGGSSSGNKDGDAVADWMDVDSDNDGILDSVEGNTDKDGDGIPNYLDLDSDNDGIPDVVEAGGVDANGNGLPDSVTDTDNDGLLNIFYSTNGGTLLPNLDVDGDGLRNYLDIDSDNDGLTDLFEAGGTDSDSNGIVDGVFTDTDNDGLSNITDTSNGGTALPLPNNDADSPRNYLDSDSDGDNIPDNIEAQIHGVGFIPPAGVDSNNNGLDDAYDPAVGGVSISNLYDFDTDTTPDIFDADSDNDTVTDLIEGYTDFDTDGDPNFRDLDSDGDAIPDNVEGSLDFDGDTFPNFLDLDSDNDGIPDSTEGTSSADGDPNSNYLDLDSDNDGIPDATEGNTDKDGDGIPNYLDLDSDNDGIPDATESSTDSDRDGIPNYLDLDSDNDGITDIIEVGGVDANQDGIRDGVVDSNNNGLDDSIDPSLGGTPVTIINSDPDLLANYLDIDSDNDGIVDNIEAQTTLGYITPTGLDTDTDGIDNAYDPDNGGTYIIPVNTDGIDNPDYLDNDTDEDGISDLIEGDDLNSNGVTDHPPLGSDFDNDGLDDAFDNYNLIVLPPGNFNSIGSNAAIQDRDGDSARDWRDTDDDNDGIPTITETAGNFDGDISPNYLDTDSDNDGIPDSTEGTSSADGDPNSNYLDFDSDNDGILDANEGLGDPDGDGIPNYLDLDSDNDGIPDATESGTDSDRDGIPNFLDLDSDNDGITDITEVGGVDANQDGRRDGLVDSNNNGLDDSIDPSLGGTPVTIINSDPDLLANYLDIDSDNDGIVDNIEAQTTLGYITPTGLDTDTDGIDNAYDPDNGGTYIIPVNTDGIDNPDYLDNDTDEDGISDIIEGDDLNSNGVTDHPPLGSDFDNDGLDDAFDNYNLILLPPGNFNSIGSNAAIQDSNANGTKDWRDADSDNDGIQDLIEGTGDPDGDGIPNYLDLDSDNDGIPDTVEQNIDTDRDGIPNYLDIDSDNDGITDILEVGGVDANQDGRRDGVVDSNNNGLDDSIDPSLGGTPITPPNSDADLFVNYLDIDSDNDGITDIVEAQTTIGYLPPVGLDTDGDGLDNAYDPDNGGSYIVPLNTDALDTPDYLDLDTDNDSITDQIEGDDANHDGVRDHLPLGVDTDSDGLDDAFDTYNLTILGAGLNSSGSNVALQDSDSDGARDWRDTDDDNDTIPTIIETAGNPDGDSLPNYLDLDSDADGLLDGDPLELLGDIDGDSIPNYLDPRTCTVTGTIQLPNGEPIPGVLVTNSLTPYVATSDVNGNFSVPDLEDGAYEFTLAKSDGSVINEFVKTIFQGQCGTNTVLTPVYKLKGAVYMYWNSFLKQVNVAVLTNKSDNIINVKSSFIDQFGNVLDVVNAAVPPHGETDLLINQFQGFKPDTYGIVKFEPDSFDGFDGHAALYKPSLDGKRTEFTILNQFEAVQTGVTSETSNTLKPGKERPEWECPQWMQIANLHETESKVVTVNIYNQSGVKLSSNRFFLPPKGARYDAHAGHQFVGGSVYNVEVVPDDLNSPYLAKLYSYCAHNSIAALAKTWGFANGTSSYEGWSTTTYVPVSSGAGAKNILVLTNTNETELGVDLTYLENASRQFAPSEVINIAPKAQVHLDISSKLPKGASGVVKVTPRNQLKVIAKAVSYFYDNTGLTSAVYSTPARPTYTGKLTSIYNNFLTKESWLRLFNTSNTLVSVTVKAFNRNGGLLGEKIIALAPLSGMDLELRTSLGLPLLSNTYGTVEVISSTEGAVIGDLVRIANREVKQRVRGRTRTVKFVEVCEGLTLR